MSQAEILVDGGPINYHHWLRREVLWASLVTTYEAQLQGWTSVGEDALSQHQGNASRMDIYKREAEPAQAFYQQGKVVGGLLSSVCTFRVFSQPDVRLIDIFGLQADTVSEALDTKPKVPVWNRGMIGDLYSTCSMLARVSIKSKPYEHDLLQDASDKIIDYAKSEALLWIEMADELEATSKADVHVNNGGVPRSVGDGIDVRQALLKAIAGSDAFTRFDR
jgi:hypothetical protein